METAMHYSNMPDVAQPDNNGAWLTVLTNQVMFVSAFNCFSSFLTRRAAVDRLVGLF